MTVEHAVELAFDPPSTEAVTTIMRRLDQAGIPSLLGGSPHVHPHVSLAVADAPSDAVAAALTGVADRGGLPTVVLASVGCFVSPAHVVYLGAVRSDALVALHDDVVARLDEAGLAQRDLYRPGRWVPHCTLAMHVASLPAALQVLEPIDLPITAAVDSLGVVEVPTGKRRATVA